MIYSNNTYDITNDISTYTRTDFSSVYDTTRAKWFMLNNTNEYEEYGIYGDSLDTTKYVGKLVEVNGHEYEWDGTEWDDLGESTQVVTSIYRDAQHTGYITFPYTTGDIQSVEATFRQDAAGNFLIATGASDSNDWRVFYSSSRLYYDCGNGRTSKTGYFAKKLHMRFDGNPMRLYNYDTSSYIYTDNTIRPTGRNFYWGYYKLDFEGSGVSETPGWLYDVVLYSDNGETPIAHYIPNIQNGVAGLYDTINESFLAPTGTLGAETTESRPKNYPAKAAPTINKYYASTIFRNNNHYTKLMLNDAEVVKMDYMSGDLLKKGEVITYSDYIHMDLDDYSSNKKSYIDLNYTPTLTTNVEITLKVVNDTFSAGDTYFFGCNNSGLLYSPSEAYGARIRTNSRPNYYFEPSYNNKFKDLAIEIPLNEDFTIRFDQTTVADKFTFYANGNIVSSCTWDLASTLSDKSLFIFACDGTGIQYAHPYEWVKEVKIYEGTTLMRDYIPAEQNNSGGLFETINEVFYGPTGNGKIIYEHIEN